jgi:hypothetical protein
VYDKERVRDRERQRKTEKDRERQRKTEKDRERQRKTEKDRERQRKTERQIDRQIERNCILHSEASSAKTIYSFPEEAIYQLKFNLKHIKPKKKGFSRKKNNYPVVRLLQNWPGY